MVTVFVVSTGLWVASGMVPAGGLVSSFLASALVAAGGAFVCSRAELRLGASAARNPKANTTSNAQLILIIGFLWLIFQIVSQSIGAVQQEHARTGRSQPSQMPS